LGTKLNIYNNELADRALSDVYRAIGNRLECNSDDLAIISSLPNGKRELAIIDLYQLLNQRQYDLIIDRASCEGEDDAELKLIKGFALYNTNQLSSARDELEASLTERPDDVRAWDTLSKIYFQLGEEQEAEKAIYQAQIIGEFNSELAVARTKIAAKDFSGSQLKLRELLQKVPGERRALALYAEVARGLGRVSLEERILASIIENFKVDYRINEAYVDCLIRSKLYRQAIAFVESTPLEELGLTTAVSLSEAYFMEGKFDQAAYLLERAQEVDTQFARISLRLATVKRAVGDSEQAQQLLSTIIEDDRGSTADAYWALANHRSFKFSKRDVESMLEREKSATGRDKQLLLFALGAAYEQQGEYNQAYLCIEQANKLVLEFEKLDDYPIVSKPLAVTAKVGGDPIPVFVMSLPRSGSTLVEQMLLTQTAFDSVSECSAMEVIVHELLADAVDQNKSFETLVSSLTSEKVEALRRRYIEISGIGRFNTKFVIDKRPENYLCFHLIRAMFPESPVLLVKREPKALAWSLFKQRFATGRRYSYSLSGIRNELAKFASLCDFVDENDCPNTAIFSYESLVLNPSVTMTAIFEKVMPVNLEDGFDLFHESDKPVRTISASQVRKPLYKDSIDHWKNFEQYLVGI